MTENQNELDDKLDSSNDDGSHNLKPNCVGFVMAEEEEKKKFNFKKIALFGIGPIALVGIGVGVGAFLFMPTQTPVEQVEALIEKKVTAGWPTSK